MTVTAEQAVQFADHQADRSLEVRAVVPDESPAETEAPADDRSRLRRRRRALVGIVVAIVGLIVCDFLVGSVIHDRRQGHLARGIDSPAKSVGVGDPLVVLQAPAIGLNEVVVEGASATQLRSGPGHGRGTPAPGAKGNAVILGRRTRYGGPFDRLGELQKGAVVAVRTRDRVVRMYEVTKVATVDADARSPLRGTATSQITLVTSTGGLFGGKLTVVTAKVKDPAAPPATTKLADPPARPAPDALDQRPLSGLSLLLIGLVLVAMLIAGVAAAVDLLSGAGPRAALIVATPVVALVILLGVFTVDSLVAATL